MCNIDILSEKRSKHKTKLERFSLLRLFGSRASLPVLLFLTNVSLYTLTRLPQLFQLVT